MDTSVIFPPVDVMLRSDDYSLGKVIAAKTVKQEWLPVNPGVRFG
jgi:hypothetical protein